MLLSNNSNELWINVLPGGNLTIINSTITSYNMTNNYYIIIQNNASFYMENSEISYAGISWSGEKEKSGLWINTSSAIIKHSRFHHNLCGAYITNSHNNTILGNTFSANNFSIYIYYSSNNIIANNTVINNVIYPPISSYDVYSCSGVTLCKSHNNTIFSNMLINDTVGILLLFSDNNRIINNTLFDNTAGMNIGISNNNIIVDNLISSNGAGLSLGTSYNNTISNNVISDNCLDGLYISNSENNMIENNVIENNTFGIYAWYMKNNSFIHNHIYNNTCGICIIDSTDTVISDNDIMATSDVIRDLYIHIVFCTPVLPSDLTGKTLGILLSHSKSNFVVNNIVDNSYYGIYLYNSYQNSIANNTITNCVCGVCFNNAESNHLTTNMLVDNAFNMLLFPSAIDIVLAKLTIFTALISLIYYCLKYLKSINKEKIKKKQKDRLTIDNTLREFIKGYIVTEVTLWKLIISIIGILFISQIFIVVLQYVYLGYIRYDVLLLCLAIAILVIVFLGAVYGPIVGFSVGFFGVILSDFISLGIQPLNHLYSETIILIPLVLMQNIRYGLYGLLPGLLNKAKNRKFEEIDSVILNSFFGFCFYAIEYLWATNYLSSVLRDFSICAMILFIIIAALLKAVKLVELKLSKHGIVHPIFPHYTELKSKNNDL